MAVKHKKKDIQHAPDILKRYLHGGSWKSRITAQGKGSQTPGNKKRSDTCQLSPIAGLPRKAFSRARSYKLRQYAEYCTFMNIVNRG